MTKQFDPVSATASWYVECQRQLLARRGAWEAIELQTAEARELARQVFSESIGHR